MQVRTAGVIGILFAVGSVVFASVGISCNWEMTATTTNDIPPITDQYSYSLWSVCRHKWSEETLPAGTSVDKVTLTLIDECYGIKGNVSDGHAFTVSIIRLLMFVSIGCLPVAMVIAVVRHFLLKTWLHQTLQIVLSTAMTVLCFVAGLLQCASFSVYKEEVMSSGSYGKEALYCTLVAWLLAWTSAMFFLCAHLCCEAKINSY